MKLVRTGWVLCLGIVALVATSIPRPVVHADGPTVIISELAWAGSTLSAQDEWIELENVSGDDVDISDWILTKDTETESEMITIPPETTMLAGAFFVISNYGMEESVLNIEPELVDTSVTLSNSKLLIKLYDSTDQLMDTAGDGGNPPAGSNSEKISMERDEDLQGWHDAIEAINLDPDVSDLASPGASNSEVRLPPTITSVSPVSGVAGEQLVIEEIVGENFSENGVEVKLIQNDKEIVAANVSVTSETTIDYAEFEIGDNDTGVWTLEVTNPDGQKGNLASAITIEEPEPDWDTNPLVRINEVYPRPGTSTNDEFIELINLSDKVVNLNGWSIDDVVGKGSSPFELDGLTLPAKGYLTLYKTQTKITLNDSGDEVHLLMPTGIELDVIEYNSAPKAQSWSKGVGNWNWTTTPTPNGNNVFTTPEPEEEPESETEEEELIEPKVNILPVSSVVISELLPDPLEGQQEFIELENVSQKTVALEGVFLEDKAGNRYKFTSGDLNPDQRLVVYRDTSGIALNNSGGEEVRLLNPDGTLISKLSYPDKAPISAAFIRLESNQGTWVSIATPGEANPTDLIEVEREVGEWIEEEPGSELPVTGIPKTELILIISVILTLLTARNHKYWIAKH